MNSCFKVGKRRKPNVQRSTPKRRSVAARVDVGSSMLSVERFLLPIEALN